MSHASPAALEGLQYAAEVTVASGYMGDDRAWCFWETEYPDEGSCGPFASRRDAEQEARAQGYVVPPDDLEDT